jgi:type III secretion system YscQ/HrcQ family protein
LDFCNQVRETVSVVLSRYSLTRVDQVSMSLAECHESEFVSEVSFNASPRVVATFVCQSTLTPFVVDVEARFAIMLIDRILGGNGDAPNRLRKLTAAELAVIEFLFLSLTSDLNQRTELPLVRLEDISEQHQSGSLLDHERTGRLSERGIAAALRLDIDGICGIVHVYLPARTLREIHQAQQLMKPVEPNRALEYAESKLKSRVRVAPDLRLSLLVGQTDLTHADLELLESGDVMIVEQPALMWHEGRIRGSLRLRVGDGDESLILGDAAGDAASTIKVVVGSVTIGESREVDERLIMQEDIEGEDAPTLDNGIDDLMLTVRVELATRRLRLGELARLRANQVLDLGCVPTDPVDLVVDGRRVARGELVDIEGRLGVRIKQVSTQLA